MLMPCEIGDCTDFYTSIHHATAVGKMFRPDNPLLPNDEWVPIGYHGRSSSIVVSGQPVRRPIGQPLGPFLSKNSCSSVSPWVVTMEALAPFRQPFSRQAGRPQPLPYLDSAHNRAAGALNIQLGVWLQTAAMHEARQPAQRLTHSNCAGVYWTLAQLMAHHTLSGCNLRTGDLLGTGTQSGPGPGQGGSMLELSSAGKQPIALPGGEQRSFLDDGDTVILRGACTADGARRNGFGECRSTVLPAV